MPRRVTAEIPLTPERQEAQESGQALFDQKIEEQAFLCYLQKRLAEMERFIANPAELVERDRYEWVCGPEYLAYLESRVSFAPPIVETFLLRLIGTLKWGKRVSGRQVELLQESGKSRVVVQAFR